MKRTSWLLSSLAAAAWVAGCGGNNRQNDSGAAGGGAETGTMPGDAGITSDTAIPESRTGSDAGASIDTAHGGARMHGDPNNPAATDGSGPADTVSSNQSDTARRVGDSIAPGSGQ